MPKIDTSNLRLKVSRSEAFSLSLNEEQLTELIMSALPANVRKYDPKITFYGDEYHEHGVCITYNKTTNVDAPLSQLEG